MVADAYARAARSGGSDARLADMRRRLDHLRSDGADSPQILVGNYANLAHDLDRFTHGAESPARSRGAYLAEGEGLGHRQER